MTKSYNPILILDSSTNLGVEGYTIANEKFNKKALIQQQNQLENQGLLTKKDFFLPQRLSVIYWQPLLVFPKELSFFDEEEEKVSLQAFIEDELYEAILELLEIILEEGHTYEKTAHQIIQNCLFTLTSFLKTTALQTNRRFSAAFTLINIHFEYHQPKNAHIQLLEALMALFSTKTPIGNWDVFLLENYLQLLIALADYTQENGQAKVALKYIEEASVIFQKHYTLEDEIALEGQIAEIKARILANLGRLAACLQSLKAAQKVYHSFQNEEKLEEIERLLGIYYAAKGDLEVGKKHFELAITDTTSSLGTKASVHQSLGIAFFEANEEVKALQHYQKAQSLFEATNDLSGLAAINNNLGLLWLQAKEFSKAKQAFKEGLHYYLENGAAYEKAMTYSNLAKVHILTGRAGEALAYLQKANKFCDSFDNKSLTIGIYESIARAYFEMSQLDLAKEYLQKTLNLGPFDKNTHFDLYFLAATIYRAAGNYPKSFQTLEALKAHLGANIQEEDLAFITHEKGNILLNKRDYLAAAQHFTLAISLLKNIANNEMTLATIYNSLGLVNLELQNYTTAIDYLEEAIEISEEFGLLDQWAHSLQNLGEVFLAKGDFEEAITYFKESLSGYQELDFLYELGGCFHGLAKAFVEINKHLEAINAYEKAIFYLEQIPQGKQLRETVLIEFQQKFK